MSIYMKPFYFDRKMILCIYLCVVAAANIYGNSIHRIKRSPFTKHPHLFQLSGKVQSDTWDYDNIELLLTPQFFIEPESDWFTDVKLFSGWTLWDGWVSYTVTFENKTRFIHSLDSAGRLAEIIEQEWYTLSNKWGNFSRYAYSYNASNNLHDRLDQEWHEGLNAWAYFYKSTYSYQADNMVDKNEHTIWVDSANSWQELFNYFYTYGQHNKPVQICEWVMDQGTWDSAAIAAYTYNIQSNIIENINLVRDSATGTWRNDYKVTCAYDSNNYISRITSHDWDSISGQWIQRYSDVYTYIDGSLSEWIEQAWDTSSNIWQSSFKSTVFYDTTGTVQEIIDQIRHTGSSVWVNLSKFVYTYNTRGNPEKIILYDWNGTNAEWQLNGDYITVSYAYTNPIKSGKIFSSKHPALTVTERNGMFTFTIPGTSSASDGLSVYDLRGRLVHTAKPMVGKNNTRYTWDTSGSNGKNAAKVYILFVTINGKKITQRLLLN